MADPTLVVSATAGVVGALVGGLISGGVTWALQSERHRHEDRVRFHDRRLDTYPDLIAAAGSIAGLLLRWEELSPVDEQGQTREQRLFGMLNDWYALRGKVDLVGRAPLREKVTEVAVHFDAVAGAVAAARTRIESDTGRLIAEMRELARAELSEEDRAFGPRRLVLALSASLGIVVLVFAGDAVLVGSDRAMGGDASLEFEKLRFAAKYCAQWAPDFVGPGIGIAPVEPVDIPNDVSEWWDICMVRMGVLISTSKAE